MQFSNKCRRVLEFRWCGQDYCLAECHVNFQNDCEPIITFEAYLTDLPKVSAKYLCKHRPCNHRLPTETGRYLKLERNREVCNLCGNGDLGDEYHCLFVCKDKDLLHFRKLLLKILLEESEYV